MYRVLIVDDEPLAREHIRQIVDWRKLRLEVCGEATDGQDALEKIKVLQPHILLLDLTMPLMDGMSLAEYVKENDMHLAVIIITGSDEFEFVRKSMKQDVKDYLLKPFDADELEAALTRVAGQIERDGQDRERSMKAAVYNLLINPIRDNVDMAGKYIDPENKVFELAVVSCPSERKCDRVLSSLRDYWGEPSDVLLLKSGTKRIICFSMARDAGETVSLAAGLQGYLTAKHPPWTDLLIGISHPRREISQLHEAFREAAATVDNGIVFGDTGIRLYEEKQDRMAEYFYSTKDLELLMKSLREGNRKNVLLRLHHIFDRLETEKVSYDHLLTIRNGLVSVCYSMLIEKNSSLRAVWRQDHKETVSGSRSLEDIKQDVIQFYELALERYHSFKMTKAQKTADECVEIIERHYADPDLSIGMISRMLDFDSSYIRRVFSKSKGTTLNHFIIQFRMQKAKELLADHTHKHADIARMVGYEDAAYFSKSFKKYVGLSPKEFEISS